jgi:hypothetical protein
MAKFEEGDPRWLVKDLGTGGTNVNNWHWTEKDCLSWCKARLDQLFNGVRLLEEGPVQVTGGPVEVSGEAFLNNRKNKIIASYELDVKVAWSAAISGEGGEGGQAASGKLLLPYVAGARPLAGAAGAAAAVRCPLARLAPQLLRAARWRRPFAGTTLALCRHNAGPLHAALQPLHPAQQPRTAHTAATPNTDENHDEDPELKVTCDSNDSAAKRAKDALLGAKCGPLRCLGRCAAWAAGPLTARGSALLPAVHRGRGSSLRCCSGRAARTARSLSLARAPAARAPEAAACLPVCLPSPPGKQAIFAAINTLVTELRAGVPSSSKAEGEGEAGAPPAAAAPPAGKAPSSSAGAAAKPAAPAAAPAAAPKAAAASGGGKQFSLTQKFYARPADLFEALTHEGRVRAFTQAQATSDARCAARAAAAAAVGAASPGGLPQRRLLGNPGALPPSPPLPLPLAQPAPSPRCRQTRRVGGKFSWFSGTVTGEYLELVPGSRIVMAWRFSTWEEGCTSKVGARGVWTRAAAAQLLLRCCLARPAQPGPARLSSSARRPAPSPCR